MYSCKSLEASTLKVCCEAPDIAKGRIFIFNPDIATDLQNRFSVVTGMGYT